MNQTFEAILLYCLWSLILTSMLLFIRVTLALTGKKASNSFALSGSDVSPFCARLVRAHANCFENLPLSLGILFTAILLGQEGVTNSLAIPFVFARLFQSITHLISTSIIAVNIRFAFFFFQIIICLYWCINLLTKY